MNFTILLAVFGAFLAAVSLIAIMLVILTAPIEYNPADRKIFETAEKTLVLGVLLMMPELIKYIL